MRRARGANRTKIVATVGPACWSPAQLLRLVRAGVDVFRLNFSHGDPATHARSVAAIRGAEAKTGRAVAILADLQGPRVRVGKLPEEGIRVRRGERIVLGHPPEPARERAEPWIPVSHARFAQDVAPGHRILVADGEIELRVRAVAGSEVEASVVVGGVLRSRKGVNLPDSRISLDTLTPKDRRDLAFAAAQGVDYVGISFVGGPEDLRTARRLLARAGSDAGLVAKIERAVAVTRLEEILEETDAVMVARGDLAVEVGYENVPVLQKRILRAANARARPTITATQMLDSMIEHPRPTRAEASDVANAVFDGTDAVMLSGETAVGKWPAEVVRTMVRILSRTERSLAAGGRFPSVEAADALRNASAIARAGVRTAADVDARCIVPFSASGRTARLVSRERPVPWIVAGLHGVPALRRAALYWGVLPRLLPTMRSMAGLFERGARELRTLGTARAGDIVVFLAGTSPVPGGTHTLRIYRMGAERAATRRKREGKRRVRAR